MQKLIPIDDVILAACMGDDDMLQQKKMKYLFYAKDIYNNDLNLTVIKDVKRIILEIDRKTHTVKLPCDAAYISGIYTIGRHGEFYPVYRNERLHDDIVDLSAIKDCNCDCGNDLCSMIKGYEAITEFIEAEMPNGSMQTFTCVTRKAYDENGDYFEEKQYPQREYTDGVWTDTVLNKEKITLCKLEINQNGCVKECEENYQKVVKVGCYKDCNDIYNDKKVGDSCVVKEGICGNLYEWECGVGFTRYNHYLNNSYNITEKGDRLIFPYDFGHRKIMIRYYADIGLKEMKIPSLAKEAFIVGLKYYETLINDEKQALNNNYAIKYSRLKWALLQELNKYSSQEMRMIMTPPNYVPNYSPVFYNEQWQR